MTVANLIEVISSVETMSGDLLTEVLAPSEIRAIAEAIAASSLLNSAHRGPSPLPTHLAWMATVPSYMHDCFAS